MVATAAKTAKAKVTTEYIVITPEVFTSVYDFMNGVDDRRVMTRDELATKPEQVVIQNILDLFGEQAFPEPGILTASLKRGRVYTPNLVSIPDKGVGAQFGDNWLPLECLVANAGALNLGAASVTVQETTRTFTDENNKEQTVPVVKLICEKVIDSRRLRMELQVKLKDDSDPTEVADILKEGDLEVASTLIAPPGGGGGFYVNAADLSKSFDVSGSPVFPMMSLPVQSYALKEFDWNNNGTIQKIKSLNVGIDPAYLPEACLIKMKKPGTQDKAYFYIEKAQIAGLSFAQKSNAYRSIFAKIEQDQAALDAAIARGEVRLNLFGYASTNKAHTPNHAITIAATPAKVDYSALDIEKLSGYLPLPGKEATEGDATAAESVPATSPAPKVNPTAAANASTATDEEIEF